MQCGTILSDPKSIKNDKLVGQACRVHREQTDNNSESEVSVFHPGSVNTWKCDLFGSDHSTQAAFSRHLCGTHQTRVSEYKCTSGYSSHSAISVGTHKQYCQSIVPAAKKDLYSHCKFSSDSDSGLKVHIARAHPKQHNTSLKEKKLFLWTEAQLQFLDKLVIDLIAKNTPKLNAVIAKLINRGELAIQKI